MSESVTFSNALASLEEVVRQLESGEASLEEAVALYSKGMQLAQVCQEKLQVAENQVAKIIDDNGQVQAFKEE
ncbi:MAG TPA: exodeoxyribonuclease VII small subunit [Metalysinibacillus jejuensis]|uniref:Exodeoxyribonuclease 7 small subunit n=1 Tax=Metalysinibacillus jejuensis TaxID=914327 RepID=A0A921NCC9_9BACL|nr:exodeoxyribonuclease VII small subunit [Metalysinibacillus jejuensis]HJH11078.1 exodeoxyribonuclease VII small subunit [Metalysinibacillus jejuensis]